MKYEINTEKRYGISYNVFNVGVDSIVFVFGT